MKRALNKQQNYHFVIGAISRERMKMFNQIIYLFILMHFHTRIFSLLETKNKQMPTNAYCFFNFQYQHIKRCILETNPSFCFFPDRFDLSLYSSPNQGILSISSPLGKHYSLVFAIHLLKLPVLGVHNGAANLQR